MRMPPAESFFNLYVTGQSVIEKVEMVSKIDGLMLSLILEQFQFRYQTCMPDLYTVPTSKHNHFDYLQQ